MQADIYTVDNLETGQLSIMARPRGGDWLKDEIRFLHKANISSLVSLLTRAEVTELELAEEATFCQLNGIEFLELPIADRGCPAFSSATFEFIKQLTERLQQNNHLVIHCRMGIGRSALIAASIMVSMGFSSDKAFAQLERARGQRVPDTEEQHDWVSRFEILMKKGRL